MIIDIKKNGPVFTSDFEEVRGLKFNPKTQTFSATIEQDSGNRPRLQFNLKGECIYYPNIKIDMNNIELIKTKDI